SSRLPYSVVRFATAAASMDSTGESLRYKLLEFPHASANQRKLMLELISSVDDRLGSSLRSCTLPRDVQSFTVGSASASLQIRDGLPSSQVDFILESWIHCKLPSDSSLNITSLSAYLKPSTNAPNFVFEIIQSAPSSIVLVLDLTPRKDPISHPDYLKSYYQETNLDEYRNQLHSLPQVKPYISPDLYFRSLVSPTSIVVTIGDTEMDAIIGAHVAPVAKRVLNVWIESCALSSSEPDVGTELERMVLIERDRAMRRHAFDADLGSSFPRLFGEAVAGKVIGALKEYF
ncbi:hypothetical protein M569_08617, partial [Genlisea aurea]